MVLNGIYVVVHYITNGKKFTKQAFTNNDSTLSLTRNSQNLTKDQGPFNWGGVPIKYYM